MCLWVFLSGQLMKACSLHPVLTSNTCCICSTPGQCLQLPYIIWQFQCKLPGGLAYLLSPVANCGCCCNRTSNRDAYTLEFNGRLGRQIMDSTAGTGKQHHAPASLEVMLITFPSFCQLYWSCCDKHQDPHSLSAIFLSLENLP